MHDIYDCVDSFTSLLDTGYRFVLGRKGVLVTFDISFNGITVFDGQSRIKTGPRENVFHDTG